MRQRGCCKVKANAVPRVVQMYSKFDEIVCVKSRSRAQAFTWKSRVQPDALLFGLRCSISPRSPKYKTCTRITRRAPGDLQKARRCYACAGGKHVASCNDSIQNSVWSWKQRAAIGYWSTRESHK